MAGPHQIDSIVPNHGVIGDTVVINGTGFGAVQGGSTVRFNPNELAAISVWSDTAITCTVPLTATIGPCRVVVAGQDPLSPRNSDFYHVDFVPFPTTLEDFEFQNEKNDSDVLGLDNLIDADAKDLNKALDLLIKLQKKVGIDGSLDPDSLDFKILGSADPIVIEQFNPVQPGAPGPVFPVPTFDFEPPGVGLYPVRLFPSGVDTELQFAFRVPRKVAAASALDIRPVFLLRAAPAPADTITMDVFGSLDGVALPPLAPSGNILVDVFPTGLPFITLPGPPLRAIPVDGAPPFAPADSEVVLRIQRLGTDGGDIFAGDIVLYKIIVDWVR